MNHKVYVSHCVPERIKVIQGQPNRALAVSLLLPMAGHGGDAMASPSESSGWYLHPVRKQEGSVSIFTESLEMEKDQIDFSPPVSKCHLTIFLFYLYLQHVLKPP